MDNVDEISNALLKIIELKTGVFKEKIFNESRKRELVMARCIYVNLMYLYTDLDETEVSKRIKKDRTSVYHMYKLHSDLMSVDKVYKKLFEDCSDRYVSMVCTAEHMLVDYSIIMYRIRNAELEIHELKKLLTSLSPKPNDELVTS
jgi:hypothetical protein